MDLFNSFQDVVNHPFEYAKRWKSKHKRKIYGYFCSYGPEELIWAAGALPFRILGSHEHISLADTHLQAYCCHLARSGLEDALSGKLDFLDGAVFPHTCDTIQRLSDIWRLNAGFKFHADFVLPVKMDANSARDYLLTVFIKFKQDLEEELKIKITSQNLVDSIKLFNDVRKRIADLFAFKRRHPTAISGHDLHTIVKASMLMDRSEFLARLIELDGAIKKKQSSEPKPAPKRVVLAGGLCSMPDVYQTIDSAGGTVVGDDMCTGTRYFEGRIAVGADPLAAIANRYAERVVCPAKHNGLRSRGKHLIKLARETGADGVIFLMLKFCDPHAFDYPYLRDMLSAEKIPSTLFEIENSQGGSGQFKTRCEAFMEMI